MLPVERRRPMTDVGSSKPGRAVLRSLERAVRPFLPRSRFQIIALLALYTPQLRTRRSVAGSRHAEADARAEVELALVLPRLRVWTRSRRAVFIRHILVRTLAASQRAPGFWRGGTATRDDRRFIG